MKILTVHEEYSTRRPSGENQIVANYVELLRLKGHTVIEYKLSNDDLEEGGWPRFLYAGLTAPWNPTHLKRLRSLLEREHPAIMHVHNTFPIFSPAIFYAAEGTSTAVVATLHNYRAVCASSTLFRDGKICTECPDRRSSLPAVLHGCYRSSRLASAPVAAMVALHQVKETWTKAIDVLTTVSRTQREVFLDCGFREENLTVLPNFCSMPAVVPWSGRENKAIYLGRIADYKGVHKLLEAWDSWGPGAPLLEIVGDGPERAALQAKQRDNVRWLGNLSPTETQERLATAKLCIVPSLWLEPFGLAAIEAMAAGVPVLAANRGALPEHVTHGVTGELYDATNGALARSAQGLWENQSVLEQFAMDARADYLSGYTPDIFYSKLLGVYGKAREHREARISNAHLGRSHSLRALEASGAGRE